ncbi:MerR family transcriptional regulator [Conexibacter sp. JD483]|uniref:MerR family transcriptional regulator n=1 Tax=unclassified Conexibacter TaxID=2627773 RepID=UPI0027202D54|nr:MULTISPECIES: MerR family transcriptional regulator [unclassified Conexibacter]MDO8184341.1 MerR family transcriptional regulator [Conexibacter sp. CPCC 205706]MDO8197647.1 MerR family transcriptional regulator [Conexibacter sp. CPCC 205762]MDR9368310.1 MerR family transcriptional regulator [Conexibacter sp. JD483]
MSGIRTNAAAVMLGVSPNTLRSWERRFGYPSPSRTSGGHRQYELHEIEALKQAFEETHNVSSAIALARQRGVGLPSASRLGVALTRFEEEKAAQLLEESMALRSLERTIEEVLLPAVGELQIDDAGQPEYEFAWRFATGWISALRRVAPPASRDEAVLIFDSSIPCDLDALRVQGLELMLRRVGIKTLVLTAGLDPARLGRALRALRPSALVLGGRRASLDTIGRLVYAARSGERALEVFDFGGALPDTGASTVRRLGESPMLACETLLARVGERRQERVVADADPLTARRALLSI